MSQTSDRGAMETANQWIEVLSSIAKLHGLPKDDHCEAPVVFRLEDGQLVFKGIKFANRSVTLVELEGWHYEWAMIDLIALKDLLDGNADKDHPAIEIPAADHPLALGLQALNKSIPQTKSWLEMRAGTP